ncbi:hypothetical protein GCM10008023_36120 [Sphingomonas glacialis]|uniref:DUF736 domain-containing protein n=1 Tax=Sphingomonas glacialis TaxID=658225 RepID=A0ABQ3LU87_9SPHN|nr:DUF736 domain-containing protein [Sphingomonas glacialis]GHH24204.1 hypothetical protein GCM10008023_36120 [Sphingomonas glacialis]
MTQIDRFVATPEGYLGELWTLTLHADLCLVAVAPGGGETMPDYRIYIGSDDQGAEVGAAWKKVGERAGAYVSLLIDDPAFSRPIRANLLHSDVDGAHYLLWTRPARQHREG